MGFNPSYIEARDDLGSQLSEIFVDFVSIDGIFLPNNKMEKQYDPSNGRIRRTSNWTFNNMRVNELFY